MTLQSLQTTGLRQTDLSDWFNPEKHHLFPSRNPRVSDRRLSPIGPGLVVLEPGNPATRSSPTSEQM